MGVMGFSQAGGGIIQEIRLYHCHGPGDLSSGTVGARIGSRAGGSCVLHDIGQGCSVESVLTKVVSISCILLCKKKQNKDGDGRRWPVRMRVALRVWRTIQAVSFEIGPECVDKTVTRTADKHREKPLTEKLPVWWSKTIKTSAMWFRVVAESSQTQGTVTAKSKRPWKLLVSMSLAESLSARIW